MTTKVCLDSLREFLKHYVIISNYRTEMLKKAALRECRPSCSPSPEELQHLGQRPPRSGSLGEEREPAGLHAATEPQTNQRRQTKVRSCTTSMNAALTIVGSPHAQTPTMSGTLRSAAPPVHQPQHPGVPRLPARSTDLFQGLFIKLSLFSGFLFFPLLHKNSSVRIPL